MTHAIDKNTGLPTIPEGFYWRVEHGSDSCYIVIALMKKRSLWFDKKIEWTVTRSAETGPNKVREAAAYILDRIDRENSIIGMYPPKKLEG